MVCPDETVRPSLRFTPAGVKAFREEIDSSRPRQCSSGQLMERAKVEHEIILIIPLGTPSLNKTLRDPRQRRTKRIWKDFALLLRNQIQLAKMRGDALPSGCFVELDIHGTAPRCFDHDNFVGGAKGLLDLLVAEELLVDDSKKWIRATYSQESPGNPETRIRMRWES